MSRADDLRTRYEAELAVLELEEKLLAAKEAGEVPRELKERLREARAVYREQRAGGATTSPATIGATVGMEQPGGGS